MSTANLGAATLFTTLEPCTTRMYSDVNLTRDVTERGLRASDVGTVLERHVVPGVAEEGYSVEFLDMTDNTVAVVTLPVSALRLPTPADLPSVRALNAEPMS